MNAVLASGLWPGRDLGNALLALARHAGLALAPGANHDGLTSGPQAHENPSAWLAWAGGQWGLEVEEVATPCEGAGRLLAHGAPAVLQLQTPQGPAYALLLGQRWGQVRLLAPHGRVLHCPAASLMDALLEPLQAPARPEIDRLLDAAQVTDSRRPKARQALLAERLGAQALHGLWILRSPATARAAGQLAHAAMAPRLAALLLACVVTYGMEMLGWRLMGGAALDGRLDTGWLSAWVLMVLSLVPLHALTGWVQTGITLDAGRMLKQRLFAGALALDVDRVRHLGTGQWLSRTMEAQALESHGLSAAMGLLVAAVELLLAMVVLWQGAAPLGHLALMAVWLMVATGLAWRLFLRQRSWTGHRLSLTHDLIERMVGHRTRLAQERPARRDADEDRRSAGYLGASQRLDAALMPLAGLLPGGWVLLAFAALLPALVHSAPGLGNPLDGAPGHTGLGATGLAISLGGILLAHRAFTGLAAGLAALAAARIAWSQVAALYKAGASAPLKGLYLPHAGAEPETPVPGPVSTPPGALLDAHAVAYRYREASPVLQGVSLQLKAGERVLLEGPSGGGKSTLAALVSGLRQPHSGLLMLQGLDHATLGSAWQALATQAPQFHENHVFAGTLAFNLLMGRESRHAGHAQAQDLADAQALCEALGLGDLLAQMPSGLQQRVGESGWQLSHGEKSRLFLARALLQDAPLTVLDESFAALDPATLKRCLDAVLQRARTLVVIAHP